MLRLAVLTTLGLAVLRSPDPPAATYHCVLAIPPRQVARQAMVVPVYSPPPIGWIAVTDPVECD